MTQEQVKLAIIGMRAMGCAHARAAVHETGRRGFRASNIHSIVSGNGFLFLAGS